VFADYEILQPFTQLGREVHRLDDQEHATGRLPRFQGLRVPTGTILGLTAGTGGAAPRRMAEWWTPSPVPCTPAI
jgi:hypothetical protein